MISAEKGLRRPSRLMGLMPGKLIEATARLRNMDGSDADGIVDVSRFGYTIRWDCMETNWWDNVVDNKFETTLDVLKKKLATVNDGYLVPIDLDTYRMSISDESIQKNTVLIGEKTSAVLRAMEFAKYIITREWYVLDERYLKLDSMNLHMQCISGLSDEFKCKIQYADDHILYIDAGKIYGIIPVIEEDTLGRHRGERYTLHLCDYDPNGRMEINEVSDIDEWHDRIVAVANDLHERYSLANKINERNEKIIADVASTSLEAIAGKIGEIPGCMRQVALANFLLSNVVDSHFLTRHDFSTMDSLILFGTHEGSIYTLFHDHLDDMERIVDDAPWTAETKKTIMEYISMADKMAMEFTDRHRRYCNQVSNEPVDENKETDCDAVDVLDNPESDGENDLE